MASPTKSSAPQTWFFLREQMSGTPEDFYVGYTDIDTIKSRGINLRVCRSLAKLEGEVDEYSFWISSASIQPAVRLLSSESIRFHYDSYCTKDPVVQITIRPAGDPSPNSSKCPSWENSSRRKEFLRGKYSFHVSHRVDPTMRRILTYSLGWIAAKATSPSEACPKDCPGRMKNTHAVNTDSHAS